NTDEGRSAATNIEELLLQVKCCCIFGQEDFSKQLIFAVTANHEALNTTEGNALSQATFGTGERVEAVVDTTFSNAIREPRACHEHGKVAFFKEGENFIVMNTSRHQTIGVHAG